MRQVTSRELEIGIEQFAREATGELSLSLSTRRNQETSNKYQTQSVTVTVTK